MASISLKISIVEKDVVKTMQFDPNTAVYDACRVIRDKITEANLGQRKSLTHWPLYSWINLCFIIQFDLQFIAKDYGLFLADEDPKKGIWLEPGRNLGYYVLRTGVCWSLYISKFLTLMHILKRLGSAGIPSKNEDTQSAHVGWNCKDNVGR